MINIKPIIKSELDKVSDNVNDDYYSIFERFPVIQYMEEDNKTYSITDGKEQLSYIKYKIDVWNNEDISDIAIGVDEVLSNLGLVRVECIDIPEKDQLKHKVMRYECIIDVNNMRVYKYNKEGEL